MYCDPMYMDVCSLEPDEEFVVFEYQILKRYNMLDRMSDDRRKQAQTLLIGDGGNVQQGSGNWLDMENPRDKQMESTDIDDHYGRSYFSPPASQNSASRKRRRGDIS
jgi:hypothetical protein